MNNSKIKLDEFDKFLLETVDVYDRKRVGQKGLSYDEAEREAFEYGWSAAIKFITNEFLKIKLESFK